MSDQVNICDLVAMGRSCQEAVAYIEARAGSDGARGEGEGVANECASSPIEWITLWAVVGTLVVTGARQLWRRVSGAVAFLRPTPTNSGTRIYVTYLVYNESLAPKLIY